jgi:hypothetical protein
LSESSSYEEQYNAKLSLDFAESLELEYTILQKGSTMLKEQQIVTGEPRLEKER